MKTLCLLLAAAFSTVFAHASTLKLNGVLNWTVTEPQATFDLSGVIQNVSPAGSSGTIKLVLWASTNPFPSPGYSVAEYTLGEISTGYQFSNFSVRTTAKIPVLTGKYYFTVLVFEYTGASWATRIIAPNSTTRKLVSGHFADQNKWITPHSKVTTPPSKLKSGSVLFLTPKATGLYNQLPVLQQAPSQVNIVKTKAVVDDFVNKRTSTDFKYSVTKDSFNNKRVVLGQLKLAYPDGGNIDSEGIALYFQGANSGTYKMTRIDRFGKQVLWGVFTFE